jgi:phage terminase large subunit GpA-like protein
MNGHFQRDGVSALLFETWEHETGAQLPIKRLAIDSGRTTREVYPWTRSQTAARVMRHPQRRAWIVILEGPYPRCFLN